jgi:nicotinate-nucleotide adenylyltransferase
MRVGIYGGSFDPVHVGHLAVADAARQQLAIEQLRWMPVGSPWQKTRVLAPAHHRVAMLRLALEDTRDVAGAIDTRDVAGAIDTRDVRNVVDVIDEHETARSGPTYTIDTLEALAHEHPADTWLLVIGQDQYACFRTWHRWRDIVARADLAVVARDDEAPATSDEVHAAITASGRRAQVLHMRAVPVSSTQIRERVARGEPIRTMVPAQVAGYIDRHGLYR